MDFVVTKLEVDEQTCMWPCVPSVVWWPVAPLSSDTKCRESLSPFIGSDSPSKMIDPAFQINDCHSSFL